MCCREESSKYQHLVCKSSYKSVALSTSRSTTPSTDLHYKKDGSLDMRYKSSQEIDKKMTNLNIPASATSSASSRQTKTTGATAKQHQSVGIPPYVPVTSVGLLDLRISAAKDWVQSQAHMERLGAALPVWVPHLKDGSPDTTKSVTRQFFSNATPPPELRRDDYYAERLMDMFQRIVEMQRTHEPEQLHVPCMHWHTHSHCVKELSRAQRAGFRSRAPHIQYHPRLR